MILLLTQDSQELAQNLKQKRAYMKPLPFENRKLGIILKLTGLVDSGDMTVSTSILNAASKAL